MLVMLEVLHEEHTCARCKLIRFTVRAVDELFGFWRDKWLCLSCVSARLQGALYLTPRPSPAATEE